MERVDLGEVRYATALDLMAGWVVERRAGRDTPKGAASLVGVWTPGHAKLVSIGMRIRGGVTSHGFALNVDPDLSVYERFTACGLDGVPMTSLRRMAEAQGRALPPESAIRDAIADALS